MKEIYQVGCSGNMPPTAGRSFLYGRLPPPTNNGGRPLWPSLFPLESLEPIRTAIGSNAWAALYQQRPAPAEGAIFRREWLKSFSGEPHCTRIIFSLDTAFKTGESN